MRKFRTTMTRVVGILRDTDACVPSAGVSPGVVLAFILALAVTGQSAAQPVESSGSGGDSGSINGRVWDVLNHPVAGATVMVTDPDIQHLYGMDITKSQPGPEDGSYSVTELPTGTDLVLFAYHENAPGMLAYHVITLNADEYARVMLDLNGDFSDPGNMTVPGLGGGILLRIVAVAERSQSANAIQQTIDQLESIRVSASSGPSSGIIHHSGREWVVGPDQDLTLEEAETWVRGLNSDWRLPTVAELVQLSDAGIHYQNWGSFDNTGSHVWFAEASPQGMPVNFTEGSDSYYHPTVIVNCSPRAFAIRRTDFHRLPPRGAVVAAADGKLIRVEIEYEPYSPDIDYEIIMVSGVAPGRNVLEKEWEIEVDRGAIMQLSFFFETSNGMYLIGGSMAPLHGPPSGFIALVDPNLPSAAITYLDSDSYVDSIVPAGSDRFEVLGSTSGYFGESPTEISRIVELSDDRPRLTE